MESTASSEPLQGGSAIKYIPALDGLRCLAILLVVWHHAPEVLHLGKEGVDNLFWHLSRGGQAGVDLFFGVSGFLITSILLETKNQKRSFVNFWARRALRIFPLHYLYLVVLVVLSITVQPGLWNASVAVEGAMWLPYFLYAGNLAILFHGLVGTPLVILWSLAIEEQFYLVWPLVVSKSVRKELARFCIAGIVLTPLLRYFAQYDNLQIQTAVFFTLCRVDPIFWGALISIAVRDATWRPRLERIGPWLALPVIASTLGLFYWAGAIHGVLNLPFVVLGQTLIAATVAAAVVLALFGGKLARRVLELSPLVWIGKRCYGIYIWHVILGLGIVVSPIGELFLGLPAVVGLLAWTLATLVVAQVSWVAFEKPLLKLKRHFQYEAPESEAMR